MFMSIPQFLSCSLFLEVIKFFSLFLSCFQYVFNYHVILCLTITLKETM